MTRQLVDLGGDGARLRLSGSVRDPVVPGDATLIDLHFEVEASPLTNAPARLAESIESLLEGVE